MDRTLESFLILSTKGILLKTIAIDGDGHWVTLLHNGDLAVSRAKTNVVYIFHPDGTLFRTLGKLDQAGSDKACFNSVGGVKVDKVGHLLAADHENDRIQVFSENGDFITSLQDDKGIKKPINMCFDEAGDILVVICHVEKQVSIYEYLV